MKRATRFALIPCALSFLVLATALPTPHALAGELCPEYVGTNVYDVASGDFDEDGLSDVAAVATPSKIAIVFGQAAARPTRLGPSIPTGAAFYHIAAGDVNGDGHVDLVATSYLAGYLRVLLGSGDGSFSFGPPLPAGSAPQRIVLADWNGDGADDAAVLSGTAPEVTILLADGAGGLFVASTLPITGAQLDIAAGDLDGDGNLDLVVLGSVNPTSSPINVYRGNGDGTFAVPVVTNTGFGLSAIAMGDLNEDGRDDLVAASGLLGQTAAVFLGQADGSLGARADYPYQEQALGGRASLADVDGDGHLDAVFLGGPVFIDLSGCIGNRVLSLRGNADGTLSAAGPSVRAGGASTGLATGDLDGDGRADAAVAGGICGNLSVHLGSASGALHTLENPARVFVDRHNEVIRLNGNKPWCVAFEPVNGSFDLATEASAIQLVSEGTGSISAIYVDPKKEIVLGDADGNLVPDLRICFSKDQLRQLFGNLNGRQTVTISVAGNVGTEGCRFSGDLTIDVIAGGNGNKAAAVVRSSADGKRWTLSFRSDREGGARLRLFDVSGRLLRGLEFRAARGWNDIGLDGRDAAGRSLRSGIYFYRVEGIADDAVTGRLVIAR